jgi:histidinol dehydrogenase
MIITPVTSSSSEGLEILSALKNRFRMADEKCQQAVNEILKQVLERKDEAVLEYTRKFDAPNMAKEQLRVSDQEFADADKQVSAEFKKTLAFAIERIQTFHEREKEESWTITREDGAVTGRLVLPVASAGLYVPGGKGGSTPLVSSVLMNGIPAGIAGVKHRVMVTPPDENGRINPALLVAAKSIGINEIYKCGSAWAIAALAFGTETIPPVDVIVGPGNQYVTEAKRQVSGKIRIDMIAGPSEVLIVADETARADYIAADMLAQAEHDPQALAICVTTNSNLAKQVVIELQVQLEQLSRKDIATQSLTERGVILVAENVDEALNIANRISPEHLELMIDKPFERLDQIRHAGAIFLGNYTPESVGDYVAGPNHVLPTMGTARVSSALGVETFIKRTSLISYTREALAADAEHIQRLANLEGLTAHAKSAAIRVDKK